MRLGGEARARPARARAGRRRRRPPAGCPSRPASRPRCRARAPPRAAGRAAAARSRTRERLVGVERAFEADELVQPLERRAGEPLGELLRRLGEAGLDPRHAEPVAVDAEREPALVAAAGVDAVADGGAGGVARDAESAGGDELLDRGLLAGEQAVGGGAPAVLEAADRVERRAADGAVRAVEVAARPGLVGVAVREDREVGGPRRLRPAGRALPGPQAVDRAAGDRDRVVGESVAEVLEPAGRGPRVVVEVDEHAVRRGLGAGVAGAREAGRPARARAARRPAGRAARPSRCRRRRSRRPPPRAAPRSTATISSGRSWVQTITLAGGPIVRRRQRDSGTTASEPGGARDAQLVVALDRVELGQAAIQNRAARPRQSSASASGAPSPSRERPEAPSAAAR